MMRNFKIIIALILLMGFNTSTVFAQKFAYIDTEYILGLLPEYKLAQAQLDNLSAEWQKEIEKQFEEVDKLYKAYQAERVLLTKEQQTKRENEIIERERQAKQLQNERFGFEGDLFKKREELIKPIQEKVFNAVNKVAKSNGFDFIFDKSGDAVMLVVNKKYDRSDDVLKELGITPAQQDDDLPDMPED